jgi:transcriptional regulator with GAF, ATPase, and Fis domain
VGGSKAIKCNVRLLAATRRDLEREVQQGRFRDDLFHRLAVARIELPPLRKRRDDIPLLARHFWRAGEWRQRRGCGGRVRDRAALLPDIAREARQVAPLAGPLAEARLW